MKIESMFSKRISRDIKGVIKIGSPEEENIKQELEEYVVTHELQKHFSTFFNAYCNSLNAKTDKMGVWISGFFGSGKSHFLKILSYILENRIVDGKSAIQYFIDDHKIDDNFTLANMKRAAEASADIILFNIDSRSDVNGQSNKDAIVKVFLKVFNDKLGYCGENPHIADLERKLDSDGRLEEFKSEFESISFQPWEEARYDFSIEQDDTVDTLVQMGYMTETAARNWCEMVLNQPYPITIDQFAKMVKKYIQTKGHDHHVVFMVDEMGQYVGDNSQLMLNLQTVVENLGTCCEGKAWVILTSQQAIDQVTNVRGNDFSKITGRFDTRLSLSSANVDEVIRKRILEKNETGHDTLTSLYDNKATTIKNLILFSDSAEMKLFSNAEGFSAVYPFIPYQFNLLSSVLTSIRINGAAGSSLAEGERSMLALFKETAVALRDKNEGALATFDLFYDALEQFIESSHRTVIIHAWENEYINPDKEENCFAVNVLKVLFMIKYVKEIAPTVENITSLMVSNIKDDRITLRKNVEDALARLVKQTLVQKNGQKYIFLTNEEQDINNAIMAQNVEVSEVTKYVNDLFFMDIYSDKKYFYPGKNNRYAFEFNQKIDDRMFRNSNCEMTLHLITPKADMNRDEASLRLMSGQDTSVLVVLPDDAGFWDEIVMYKKIEKFFQTDTANSAVKYEQIKYAKRQEMNDHKQNAKLFLQEALRESVVYVNGNEVISSVKEIKPRVLEALGKLADNVYFKLGYIDSFYGEADILTMLDPNAAHQISILEDVEHNKLALDDMRQYVFDNTSDHSKYSLRSIVDRYTKKPYGFVEADISWLVAKLFKDGDLSWTVSSEPVTIVSKTADELTKLVTRKENYDKLMIGKRPTIPASQIADVKFIMKTVFGISPSSDDTDIIMANFKSKGEVLKAELEGKLSVYGDHPQYPGKAVLSAGRKLIIDSVAHKYPQEFFKEVAQLRDEYESFAEDYESVVAFFSGTQKDIFDKTLKNLDIFEKSKTYIVNSRLEDKVKEMRRIIAMPSPYTAIPRLPDMLREYAEIYSDILDRKLNGVLKDIEEQRDIIVAYIEGKKCREIMSSRVVTSFAELNKKAESETNLATLMSYTVEAEALTSRLKKETDYEESKISGGDTPNPPPVKHKTIYTKNYYPSGKRVKSEEDIDSFIEELRVKLKTDLGDNDYLDIKL